MQHAYDDKITNLTKCMSTFYSQYQSFDCDVKIGLFTNWTLIRKLVNKLFMYLHSREFLEKGLIPLFEDTFVWAKYFVSF